jgi:hypothetical protein
MWLAGLPRYRQTVTRRQATLLRAFCVWTVFVWVVFVRNIWGDDTRSTGFKLVHTVLAAVSVAFALAGWIVVRRIRRVPRAAPSAVAVSPDSRVESSSRPA